METYLKHVFRRQEWMEDEINQTIYTSKSTAIVEMFEGSQGLIGWLSDYRIKETNTDYITGIVDKYNEKHYKDFLQKVEKEVEIFTHSYNYLSRKHLDEYEWEQPAGFVFGTYHPPTKVKETFYGYYVIKDRPEYIDTYFLPNYFETLDSIVGNFRNILAKYVNRYKEGKLLDGPPESLQPNLPPPIPKTKRAPAKMKMEVNLSAKELVFLFRLLQDIKPSIFDVPTNQALYKFISDNFTTKATRGKSLSIGKMRSLFTEDDVATANAWIKRLQEMLEQAKKRK